MNPPPSGPTLEALKETLAKMLVPLKGRLITPNRITEGALIANGGYGGVRAAELRDHPDSPTFENVAVKKLFPNGEDHERIELIVAFARELKAWSATDHPNILPLIGFFLDPDSSVALFVSPFMPHGSIRTYLRKATPSLVKRFDLAIDIADGLAYLHTRNPPISHGDIKPSNIVINHELRAMLCDFGLARVVQDHPSGLTTAGFDEAGTLPYQSPELVHVPGTRRNAKSDAWAFGGVLVEVLTDEPPYKKCSNFAIYGKLKEGILPAPLDELPVSAPMQSLLRRCWANVPGERSDMSECSSVLRLEKAKLGAVENASLNETTSAVPEEDPIPESLIGALAALYPYRMSEEIIKFDASRTVSANLRLFAPYRQVYYARLHGAFRWAVDGTAIAVAKITLGGERRERLEEVERYARQISFWAGLNDPKVYPFLGFTVNEEFGEVWVIGPWEENGCLQDYIAHANPSQAERTRLAIDVAQGLRALHAQSPAVIHGNIYAQGVMVGSAGQAMIAGFASAVVREGSGPTIPHAADPLPSWVAPEVDGSHNVTSASDAWSYGCLLLEIFLRKSPYNLDGRGRGRGDPKPASEDALSSLPGDLRQLMLDCWKFDPDERPTIQHCIDVLTRLLEQETRNLAVFGPAPSSDESAGENDVPLHAPASDDGNGKNGGLVVRDEADISPQPLQPPLLSPFVRALSTEEPAIRHNSSLDTPDRSVRTGRNGGSAVQEARLDLEEEPHAEGCWRRLTCIIQ